jgi:hypothetical protein
MGKLLITGAVALSAAVLLPGRAFANERAPVKLTDAQLDEVVGGDEGGHHGGFSLSGGHGHDGHGGSNSLVPAASGTQVTFIIRDVQFTFNIGPNSPVNLSTVFQFALLGSPTQVGSSTAFQTHH